MKNSNLGEYVSPEFRIVEIQLRKRVLIGSDWDNASMPDDYNDLYNL